MHAANIVSALTTKQAEAMRAIEAAAKTDRDQARVLLGSLLARTFNASARHSIRCQAESFGL